MLFFMCLYKSVFILLCINLWLLCPCKLSLFYLFKNLDSPCLCKFQFLIWQCINLCSLCLFSSCTNLCIFHPCKSVYFTHEFTLSIQNCSNFQQLVQPIICTMRSSDATMPIWGHVDLCQLLPHQDQSKTVKLFFTCRFVKHFNPFVSEICTHYPTSSIYHPLFSWPRTQKKLRHWQFRAHFTYSAHTQTLT